ncbi:MFS transporter [Longispora fulva]|uniref:EmrB/QacA subfamily drug resistance transporter n=1 Tax=Longispora fulva TaxID=619741 RepID=A0A8J7GVD5_9ACTN|nr:MFS transporter [Longispora fulva]MBG6139259.1 EmrB/QacA subfamily drug resistance transporter [Longispora fulva]GIG58753.1 MFS transporter [Longispora fulva]
MATEPQATVSGSHVQQGRHPGIALAVITSAQLMIVLDATIVNIALPQIQRALGFSSTDLSWVLNAYTLTFGGLLLLGGRAGDILGRRRVFIFGILLFTLASLLGGLAQSAEWLLLARALQGIGGAIASPTALSLITTNFDEGPERNRAFGVFAAVSGAGAAIGLIAGGMLTSWLSWRWTLFVNVPIGIALALLAPRYIKESERHPGRFDVAGAIASTAGMSLLVYGFIRAADKGWSDTGTIVSFVAAAVLLAGFVLIERRSAQPITPLHLFRDRDRVGTYVVMLITAAAMFGMFFFLTLFVQNVLGYSPLRAGFAFVPVTVAIGVTAQLASRIIPRTGPKILLMIGGALAATGLIWLSRISESSQYVTGLLLPMCIFGLGMGFIFVPVTIVALARVANKDSGAASGMLNAMQMVGGSLGLSVLVTVFGTASRNEAAIQVKRFLAQASPEQLALFQKTQQLPKPFSSHVLAHGISSAFQLAALLAVVALVVTTVVIRRKVAGEEAGTAAQPMP